MINEVQIVNEEQIVMKIERLKEIIKEKGVIIHSPDYWLDLSQPMSGKEARDFVEDLRAQNGIFKSIKAINLYDLVDFAGFGGDEDFDDISDILADTDVNFYEAPVDYEGDVVDAVLFFKS